MTEADANRLAEWPMSERERSIRREHKHANLNDFKEEEIHDLLGVIDDERAQIIRLRENWDIALKAAAHSARRTALEEAAKALAHLGAVYDTKRRDAVYTEDLVRALINPEHKFRSVDM